ncbi:MAG: phosphoenolpyruvate--protein phosphotransferase [Spirochaetaceae bacterium]|jgi:phosphotransferase system enzyme I (PtsI)|nr:phosphoenolpyruvate--protein phosphotransferase [Spirochaetaceae bacterium]
MKILSGTPVSPGIAIGKAFLFVGDEFPKIPRWTIKKNQIEAEWSRFHSAIKVLCSAIKSHIERAGKESNKDHHALLKTQLLMLEDVDFQEQLRSKLEKDLANIEWIVWSVSHVMVKKLLAARDAYLRERATDIADVASQIINNLLKVKRFSLADLKEDVIVVSHDLLPSQTMTMNKTHVKALVMDSGSAASHTAILVHSFDIPSVLGLSTCTKEINSGDLLIVDGDAGKVFVNPEKDVMEKYKDELLRFEKVYLQNFNMSDVPPETRDGRRFSVMANIELPSETGKAFKYGAHGIGLFRSEYLLIASGEAASEEKQFQAYLEVIKAANGMPVKIRTSDVGGDKMLPALLPKEEKNPLLGCRAIRFSIAMPELFKTQLRAILRAAVHGAAEIIFPLISCVEEYDTALALLEEARDECAKNGHEAARRIKTGVMIEVPSAAISAAVLAKKADFFSIGTNDLTQYTLAVDRGNEKVNYLARSMHPAVLYLIKNSIDAAHREGKTAALCGEIAGMPRYTALLAGLGLDEFSMNASSIPEIKRALRSVNISDCDALAEEALGCASAREIDALLDAFLKDHPQTR